MCSMFCMITYGMRRPQMFTCFQNECDTQTLARTHTHTSVDSAKETHTDSMLFQRRTFHTEEMKASRFLSRHHERALLHLIS